MFKKVLIANRGDVAIRVMRACRELGVKSIAVYSDADRNAVHVRYADEAYSIGEAASRSSYLNIPRIIDVAIRSRADAVHPGYGFLAENPRFAQACSEAELSFVGPEAATIRMLGDRLAVRECLRQRGFPVLPASHTSANEADFLDSARQLGYPVMVRPVAGTGGRGERVVSSEEDLREAVGAASSEAETAFGDGAVYLERVLPGVRRIEVQVLADAYGAVICPGESEGTIQRRHQKLIEESPSPSINAGQRAEMQQMAIDIARALNYVTAGTIEFLLDQHGQFYFSEMHSRLHVEHPVIEMVSGLDIVKEQMRIASGRRLRHAQDWIVPRGNAIGCRILAEDPYDGFKPSVGRVSRLIEPGGPGIRVESGIGEGSETSHYYDPLISQVIAWAESRGEAILRARRALDEYRIAGVRTNAPFLQQILKRTSFIGGRFEPADEEQYFAMVEQSREELMEVAAITAVWLAHRDRTRPVGPVGGQRRPSPWKMTGRWEEMAE